MFRQIAIILQVFFCYASASGQVETKIIPRDGLGSDFGHAVSLDGEYAIIGAPSYGGLTDRGAAYILKYEAGNWVETDRLIARDTDDGDWFGFSVDISENHVVIGAVGDNTFGIVSGAVYFFENVNGSWHETAKFLPVDGLPFERFGHSVAIDGKYAIVGAKQEDFRRDDPGYAIIYELGDAGWKQVAKLIPDDTQLSISFGKSVAIDGDFVVVGAWDDFPNGATSGSAYFYERRGSEWIMTTKVDASDGDNGARFGASVSVKGNYAIIGAPFDNDTGSAYIYKFDGINWVEDAKLIASDQFIGDWFGTAVSVSENHAVVGARFGGGRVFVFQCQGSDWVEVDKLEATDNEGLDRFGNTVSVSDQAAIVGEVDREAAYIYDLSHIPSVVKQHPVDVEAVITNYPNPFSHKTTFIVEVDDPFEEVTIVIYDLLGREIARATDGQKLSGSQRFFFDFTNEPSGVLIYEVRKDGAVFGGKIVHIKQ